MPRHFGTAADDSHDDFKPQVKAAAAGGAAVDKLIEQDISGHDVFIYMKGVPQAPMCGFSNMACAILNLYGKRLLRRRWATCKMGGSIRERL